MQEQFKANIREIFTSIQGEGPYIGQKHIFVRFCKCNLNCNFCDTDFNIKNSKLYTTEELYNNLKDNPAEVISFTGGEPLLDYLFLKEFLSKYRTKLNKKIYLETNGTLVNKLKEIIDLIDVVSMDIKIKSATNQNNQFDINDEFINIVLKKEYFIKVVFDKNITNKEMKEIAKIAKNHSSLVILQPKMPMDKDLDIEKIYDSFYKLHNNTRLIPQVHKFLNLL